MKFGNIQMFERRPSLAHGYRNGRMRDGVLGVVNLISPVYLFLNGCKVTIHIPIGFVFRIRPRSLWSDKSFVPMTKYSYFHGRFRPDG